MKELLITTKNKGKAREIKEILNDLPIKILTLSDFDYEGDIPETGSTYEENAAIKAKKGGEISGFVSLADDVGMEVNILNGFPGINSRRFVLGTDEKRNKVIIEKVKDFPENKRTARYVGVVAIFNPETGEIRTFKSKLEGKIILEPRGENGFGYDPIFYLSKFKRTIAELSTEEKNKISHRGKALTKAKKFLKEIMSL